MDVSSRVSFENRQAEILTDQFVSCDAAYMLDLIHHIPKESHRSLIEIVYQHLSHKRVLILKDIATRPRYKVAFTWILDMLMSLGQPPGYIDTASRRDLLQSVRFDGKFTHF